VRKYDYGNFPGKIMVSNLNSIAVVSFLLSIGVEMEQKDLAENGTAFRKNWVFVFPKTQIMNFPKNILPKNKKKALAKNERLS